MQRCFGDICTAMLYLEGERRQGTFSPFGIIVLVEVVLYFEIKSSQDNLAFVVD